MRRQLESAWATLREWWKGERSPTEPMLCFLLSLHYAVYLTFLLLWLYRESTVSEVLEWRIFVQGWLLVPAAALGLALAVLAFSGAQVAARTATLTGLAALNALGLVAAAAAIRSVGTEWTQTASKAPDSLASLTHAAVALLPPFLNAAALVAFRKLPVLRLPAGSQAWIVALIPLTLTLSVALLGVSTPPSPQSITALLGAAVLLTLARHRVRLQHHAGLTRLGDAVVIAIIAWLVFDPHLHFDVAHHNWFLGPTNAVMQGGTMLGDAVSAYGVLPIYFLAGVFSLGIVPISYVGLAALVSLLVIIEYGILYAMLRLLRVSLVHAALASAMIFLVNFIGLQGWITAFPSLSPLRFGIPYLLLLIVVLRDRNPKWVRFSKGAESLIVATAAVWSLETFLFTVSAYGGIVAFEAAVEWRRGGSWLRSSLRRLAWTALGIGLAHLAFTVIVYLRTDGWPNWEAYFAFIRAYSPLGEGFRMVRMPRIGAWVSIVAIYAGSLIGCVWSLPRIRTRSGGSALVVVLAMTLTGIAQFSTYLAMSEPWRLYAASIPAIFVLAFWVDRLARRSALAPRGFRRSTTYCAYSAALLVVLQLAQPLGEWIDHSSYDSLTRGHVLHRTGGCPSFPSCLRRPKAEYRVTEQAERLIRKNVPRGEAIALFLAENPTTEVLFRTGRRHAFPLSASLQDGLSRSNGKRILNAAHTLAPGDLIFVARESLAVKTWGNWLLRSIVDRICLEFECRVENRVGLITVERLYAR